MLRHLRIWLNKPLAQALEGLEGELCALKTTMHDLEQAWVHAEQNLDGTYRRVHSELGYIDKRSADLRKAEKQAEGTIEDIDRASSPFPGGRRAHASRLRR